MSLTVRLPAGGSCQLTATPAGHPVSVVAEPVPSRLPRPRSKRRHLLRVRNRSTLGPAMPGAPVVDLDADVEAQGLAALARSAGGEEIVLVTEGALGDGAGLDVLVDLAASAGARRMTVHHRGT